MRQRTSVHVSGEAHLGTGKDVLKIALDPGHVTVSGLSSLLRVVQATLREVARNDSDTRRYFDRRPQPVLMLSRLATDRDLVLQFAFTDPSHSTTDRDLSARAFRAFVDRFAEFLKGVAQPGLWGYSARRSPRKEQESDPSRRMSQLRMELRRFPSAELSFGGRVIRIEGDQMEIL